MESLIALFLFLMNSIFSDLYTQSIKKVRQIISIFKDNKKFSGILNTFYDGIGAIVEMLANAATCI